MRFSAGCAANAAAWGGVAGLIAAALALANRLGFLGLALVGAGVWLVCVRAEMNDDVPTSGTHALRARLEATGTPEQRAALAAERRGFVSPLRFYGRCGMALTGVGVAGLVWQLV